jgi:hypothetical protein
MPRMTKPERTQLWLDRLSRHAASQLTVAEFCQREEISSPSFYHWKRRLTPRIETATKRRKSPRSNQSRASLAATQKTGFTELVINSAPATAAATLPGDITISLGTQPEIAALIVDRLLQHVANLAVNKAASC